MCGIVGYIGHREACPILIKGLKRLEYRGYDSAGIALINKNKETNQFDLNIYKAKGKVADLEAMMANKDISGTLGIAHTRWATHGEPNQINAHPHFSEDKDIALVHNGIIENYATLKETLKQEGVEFSSTTDTEVLVQLISFLRKKFSLDLVAAIQLALTKVVGAYAIAVIEKSKPEVLVAARKSSPLVVGLGEDEFFLASDATPIIEYTKKVIYLEDEEIAILERGHDIKITDLKNVEIKHDVSELDLSIDAIEKGGYPHFMIKEIFEQPQTIKNCMSGRLHPESDSIVLSGVHDNLSRYLNARRIIIVACGTCWHAGLIGEQLIEEFCPILVDVD